MLYMGTVVGSQAVALHEVNDMYFEIWQNAQNKNWDGHLKAANNQIIAHGEGYQNRSDCLHVIELVKQSYSAPVRE